jgi:hypothetical protein
MQRSLPTEACTVPGQGMKDRDAWFTRGSVACYQVSPKLIIAQNLIRGIFVVQFWQENIVVK